MTHANVGSLLVYDPAKVKVHDRNNVAQSKDAVVGIITERGWCLRACKCVFLSFATHASHTYTCTSTSTSTDYLTKVVVKGRQSTNTKISEIMTPSSSLITVSPQHSVLDVMELMVEKNFRHVPVIEGGAMTGMVSIRDVVHVMLKEHREEVGRLNEYIQGTF